MPTPSAPPKTENAVRSISMTLSPVTSARNSKRARMPLLMILRSDRPLPVAWRNKRASITEDTHSAPISDPTTNTTPNNRLSKVVLIAPNLILMSSRSCSKSGNRPLAHSTTHAHTIHETVCSSSLTHRCSPHKRCTILTIVRMTTSARITGKAIRNSEARTGTRMTCEAREVNPSHRIGKSTPS